MRGRICVHQPIDVSLNGSGSFASGNVENVVLKEVIRFSTWRKVRWELVSHGLAVGDCLRRWFPPEIERFSLDRIRPSLRNPTAGFIARKRSAV